MLIDRVGRGTSADWGVHVGGKLADGKVGYAFSAIEGNGYKNPTRSKSLDFEGRVSFVPVTGLTAAVGFYSGKLGKDVEGTTTPALHTASRVNALLAYGQRELQDRRRVLHGRQLDRGDQYCHRQDPTGSRSGVPYKFSDLVSGFVRYDNEKPNKDTAPSLKDEYYNIGVSFKPRKGVDLSVVYKHEEAEEQHCGQGHWIPTSSASGRRWRSDPRGNAW